LDQPENWLKDTRRFGVARRPCPESVFERTGTARRGDGGRLAVRRSQLQRLAIVACNHVVFRKAEPKHEADELLSALRAWLR